jgi:hypothetical protein
MVFWETLILLGLLELGSPWLLIHAFTLCLNWFILHIFIYFNMCNFLSTIIMIVTTLVLGSWPRHEFTRGWAKRRTWECGRVWGWTFTLPSELPCWELDSRWTPKTLENDYKRQNPSPWGVLYIIANLSKCRCPKWARMIHLDICNTSYGQNKGRESNW